jgi:hypothetical protein
MLTLLTYETKRGLQQYLQSNFEAQQWLKLVTPFPAKADALRASWSHRPQTDVLTLSRFTADIFEGLADKPAGPWRKSRLLLQLNAFRHALPQCRDLDFGSFKTAYQVFSDLRAYTDADEFPDELLATFDERISLLAQLFHQGTRSLGILDEHAATFELTARLRSPEGVVLANRPVIVFDGFTFVTPAQLSFMEALAIRHEVVVPLPHLVWQQSHALDWPKALEMSAHHTVHVQEEKKSVPVLRMRSHTKGSLGSALRLWRKDHKENVHIVLGTKSATENSLQEIPFADSFIKQAIDITSDARDALFNRWEQRLARTKGVLSGESLLNWIEEEKKQIVAQKNLAALRELAVVCLVEKAIQDVPGCLAVQPLDYFLLSLLREVIALDAPRNNLIPLLPTDSKVSVYSLKDFHALPSDGVAALCIDGSLGPVKSDHRPFSPEMEKLLAKLGPVRRPELEFLFLRAELAELWPRQDLTLLIEDGLLKHDLGWKRIFEGFEFDAKVISHVRSQVDPNYSFFQAKASAPLSSGKISASRLQDFLDCPRRYYADRIEKIVPRVEATLELEPMTLGTIEHGLVEWGWKQGANVWAKPGELEAKAMSLVDAHDKSKRLSSSLRAAAASEAAIYARNGLERLAALVRALPGTTFEFEAEIKVPGRTGFIDCLGSGGGVLLLLDFKRSKGKNPSLNAWEEDYPKIQLWFYLRALQEQGLLSSDQRLGVGYLFFKDLDKSWIACDSSVATAIETVVPDWAQDWDDLEGALQRYGVFEDAARARLASETSFLPRPREAEVCDNCALRALCPQSGMSEEAE